MTVLKSKFALTKYPQKNYVVDVIFCDSKKNKYSSYFVFNV